MSAGKAIGGFFALGLVLMFAGIAWLLMNDIVNDVLDIYLVDSYYMTVSFMGHNVIPIVILFVGVICVLISAASKGRSTDV